MKIFYKSILTLIAAARITGAAAQVNSHHHTHNPDSLIAAKLNSYQHVFDRDSIDGFNEIAARQQAALGGSPSWEQKILLSIAKRKYINTKYGLDAISYNNSLAGRPAGAPGMPSVQAPCTNVDFETGNTTGWTMTQGTNANSVTHAGCCPAATARFQVVTPGTDPTIAALQRVPPGGGNFALKIGDGSTTGGFAVQASQTFTVTAANSVFIYNFAVVLEDAGHTCVDQPYFNISFTDCGGNPIPCAAYNVVNSSASCLSGDPTFVTSGAYKWKNWTTRSFDLSAYIGQCVTIEFIASDCAQSGHAGWGYIDCSCQPMSLILNNANIAVGSTNNFICSAGTNTLCAPTGFTSYSWTGPGVAGQTGRCVNVNASGNYSVTLGMAGSSCSSPVLYSNFAIITAPLADFTYTAAPCQTTFSVPFTSTSSNNGGPAITSYTWSWGDGNSTPNGNINETHTYTASGTKTVTLKVSNGCLDSITKVISVSPRPVANFTTVNNCVGVASTFSSTSTGAGGLVAQVWNWGDNSGPGMGVSPTHIYTSPNTYTVKLVVTDAGLCKDSISKPITIYPKPLIAFTANPVCLGTASSFTNTSSVTPAAALTWAWDFDNNGTVDNMTQSPTNAFATVGTKTVELRATTPNGCSDSATAVVRVNVIPTATFTPVNACTGANILLNNMSNVPNPDNISQYNWNFGAGATPAAATSSNSPVSYATSGVKTITLNITANTTCTASITKTVTVHPTPVASFSATAVCQGTQTAFTDLSTTGTGAINAWSWDFTNDGTVDNLTQNPGFGYPASGNYTVALQVSSTNGCVNTFTLPVDVWGHSIPNFFPNNVCHGAPTTFTNTTNTTTNPNTGGTPTYVWVFDDGSPNSNVANPVHSYTLGTNGNAVFNTTMTATSTHGCVDFIVKPVNVYSTPTASFTSNVVCHGMPTQFTDASNGNGNVVNAFFWDFSSDGTIDASGVPNPNYTFPNYGLNTVSYTIATNPIPGLTCSHTTTVLTAFVNPNPVPDFTFVNKCINTQPNSFDASSTTIAVGTNTNYAWAYGDGAVATGTLNTHNYAAPAIYNVTLTVTSNQGCVKNVVKQVEVYKMPDVNIIYKNACDGAAVSFTAAEQPGSGTVTDWFWDYNNNISTVEFTGSANASFIYPAAGQQTVGLVIISNPGQCRDTVRAFPYVNYIPKPNFTVNDPDGCSTHCVNFTNSSTVTGPAQIKNWTWNFGDGSTPVSATTGAGQSKCYNNLTGNQLKYYDVKLTTTTDSGCTDFKEYKSMITVFPIPTAEYAINPDPGNVVTPLEYFTNYSANYTKWYWTFGDGGYKTDSVNVSPSHLYVSETARTYYTNLIVKNQYGCSDTAMVPIEIGPEFAFYVPNAFTPFGTDGINDKFTGVGIGIQKYDMWIFDRWGEMIFYSDDIAKGWDGRRQGKSAEIKQEVFVYKIKVLDVLGQNHGYVGHVTLLR